LRGFRIAAFVTPPSASTSAALLAVAAFGAAVCFTAPILVLLGPGILAGVALILFVVSTGPVIASIAVTLTTSGTLALLRSLLSTTTAAALLSARAISLPA
jgi:hypothetical protein